MDDIMNICFVSDSGYAKFLETTIISILLNSSEDDRFHFHVMDDNIDNQYKFDIQELKKIKNFDITYHESKFIKKYKMWTQFYQSILGDKFVWNTHSIYYKLDPFFLFDDIDKLLILDIDQVVLTRINKFFEIDMEDNYMLYSPYPKYQCNHFAGEEIDKQYKELLKSLNLVPVEKYFVLASALVYNLKLIRQHFSKQTLENLLDEYFDKNKHLASNDEKIFPYLFRNKMLIVDQDLDEIIDNDWDDKEWNKREIKILHYSGKRIKEYISYNYNKEIDMAYITFWEYFCQTPFYKNNYIEYSNIHMAHLRRWLLQEREERKWHIEDTRNYIKNNHNKLLNMILWIIPFKSLRDKIRKKYIINELY